MLNFVHFIKHFKHTGAVAPSSAFLVKEMIESLKQNRKSNHSPVRILELGPGTGVITKEIIRLMRPGDHLDIVELDPDFYKLIRKKYTSDNIAVHGLNVLDFEHNDGYDFIISSIPYDQIPSDITKSIWKKKLAMTTEGGRISYYKYYKFNYIRCRYEWMINRKYLTREKLVLRNMPPAMVYSLKIDKQ